MIEIQQATVEQGQVGKDLFIAQYSSLRSEIHQRLDQRQQLLTYTLVGAASFLSIGVQPGVSGLTVLCYPLLAFFLACAWSQHNTRIGQLNVFLREIEDKHLPGFGWESYRRATFKKKRSSLSGSVSFSARGLFAGSELLALIVGVARFLDGPQMLLPFGVLVIVDALAIMSTAVVLEHRRARGLVPTEDVKVQEEKGQSVVSNYCCARLVRRGVCQ